MDRGDKQYGGNRKPECFLQSRVLTCEDITSILRSRALRSLARYPPDTGLPDYVNLIRVNQLGINLQESRIWRKCVKSVSAAHGLETVSATPTT